MRRSRLPIPAGFEMEIKKSNRSQGIDNGVGILIAIAGMLNGLSVYMEYGGEESVKQAVRETTDTYRLDYLLYSRPA